MRTAATNRYYDLPEAERLAQYLPLDEVLSAADIDPVALERLPIQRVKVCCCQRILI